MSFLRILQFQRPHRHLKPIIFLQKFMHFALHTEVNFKCHFCESSKSLFPKDSWNLSFSYENPYILLSILRSTLSVISAIPPNPPSPKTHETYYFPKEIHTFCSPYWGQLKVSFLRLRQIRRPQRHMKPSIFLRKSIHFAFHTEVNFKCHFCDSAKSVAPKDTWNLSFS